MKYFLILHLFWINSAFGRNAADSNNLGADALRSEKWLDAEKKLSSALASEPFQFETHVNFTVLKIQTELLEEARKAAEGALETAQTDEQRMIALFNMAGVEALSKNIPKALELYQQVLELVPDHLQTKENIEILMQSQSGGGGGEGDQENKDENKEGESGEEPEDRDGDRKDNRQIKQPFKSKDLSEKDVKRIFEELLQQENAVRREFDKDQRRKDQDSDKNW